MPWRLIADASAVAPRSDAFGHSPVLLIYAEADESILPDLAEVERRLADQAKSPKARAWLRSGTGYRAALRYPPPDAGADS